MDRQILPGLILLQLSHLKKRFVKTGSSTNFEFVGSRNWSVIDEWQPLIPTLKIIADASANLWYTGKSSKIAFSKHSVNMCLIFCEDEADLRLYVGADITEV